MPTTLNSLTNLEQMYLNYNQLSGAIPDLSALSKLTHLYLNNNRLSGAIPDLGALTKLTHLYLNNNRLSGPILDLGALTYLTSLSLTGNQLCLPGGSALEGANSAVTVYLNNISLPACTATVPAAPQNLAVSKGEGQVTLTWDAVTDAASYDLWTWDGINRQWGAIAAALSRHQSTRTLSSPTAETTTTRCGRVTPTTNAARGRSERRSLCRSSRRHRHRLGWICTIRNTMMSVAWP